LKKLLEADVWGEDPIHPKESLAKSVVILLEMTNRKSVTPNRKQAPHNLEGI
jgi:hypothetical protein